MAFAVELIPEAANLFRRVHHTQYNDKTGVVSSAAFRQERMSVNWKKYSDAENTADSNSAAVVSLICGACQRLGFSVEHTPVEPDQPGGPNQAYAEVGGHKNKLASRQLRELAKLVWLRTRNNP